MLTEKAASFGAVKKTDALRILKGNDFLETNPSSSSTKKVKVLNELRQFIPLDELLGAADRAVYPALKYADEKRISEHENNRYWWCVSSSRRETD